MGCFCITLENFTVIIECSNFLLTEASDCDDLIFSLLPSTFLSLRICLETGFWRVEESLLSAFPLVSYHIWQHLYSWLGCNTVLSHNSNTHFLSISGLAENKNKNYHQVFLWLVVKLDYLFAILLQIIPGFCCLICPVGAIYCDGNSTSTFTSALIYDPLAEVCNYSGFLNFHTSSLYSCIAFYRFVFSRLCCTYFKLWGLLFATYYWIRRCRMYNWCNWLILFFLSFVL